MPTYQEHVDGVLAAFNASEKVAYSIDALPDLLPPAFISVSVSRRRDGVDRASGEIDGHFGRVVATAVGLTLAQTYRMWDLIDSMENSTFTIGGLVSTPVQFETDDEQISPDSGRYAGTKWLRYAI